MRGRGIIISIFLVLVIFAFAFLGMLNMTGFAIVDLQVGEGADYVDGDILQDDSINSVDATTLTVGDDGAGTGYRFFIDFNTSSIQDSATVSNVTLQLTVETTDTITLDIFALTQTADSRIDASEESTLNDECEGIGSTLIYDDFLAVPGAGVSFNVTLNSAARTNLQNNLGSDFFSLCITNTTTGSSLFLSNKIVVYSINETTASRRPLLIVDYDSDSTAPDVTIVSPENKTYGNVSFPLDFNITISEAGYCEYSLDGGVNNFTMESADDLKFGDTNETIAEGGYVFTAYCNDSAGNTNYTESIDFSVDVTFPTSVIVHPENTTYNESLIDLNFSAVDSIGLDSCWYSTNDGASNSTTNDCKSNFTGLSAVEGSNNWTLWVNDSAGNENYSIIRFTRNSTSPLVTINSPTATTYTSSSVSVNISLNKEGYCEYSLNSGGSNNTLTANAGNTEFTGTTSSLSNADYVLIAYCNDTFGNTNYTENVSFTISVSSSSPGGVGSSCTVTSWDCEDWGVCINGIQERECISNCNGVKTETRNCSENEENVTECVNECSEEGVYCNGDFLETCSFIDGCYKITLSEQCSNGCVNGSCVDEELNILESVLENNLGDIGGSVAGFIKKIPKPSDIIPHGDIPDVVVDTGTGVAVVGGASWIGWLWLLTLIPFFLRKLRHYSVSVVDSGNDLKIFTKSGKIKKEELMRLLSDLDKNYEKLLFAAKQDEVVKYLVEDGFVEIRLDKPFIIIGHFTDIDKSERFERALKNALNRMRVDVEVLQSIEKVTIWRAIRAWLRERRSRRIIKRAMKR